MLKHSLPVFLAALALSGYAGTASAQNAPPVLDAIGNKTVNEGSLLTFTATASDFTGSALLFSLVAPVPAGAAIDPITGVFTWTPSESQGPGPHTVTVRVTRAIDSASEQETLTVTVNEVNQPPVLNAIGNMIALEGALTTFTATATDADLPAQTLTFSLTLGSPAATGAAITAGGDFAWTPNSTQGGLDYPVTIAVADNGTPSLSDSETFMIHVGPTVPSLDPIGNKTADEGSTLSFTATVTDPEPGQTFSLVLGSPPANGAIINPSTGAFSWLPAETQGPGVYSITVRVTAGAFIDEETISVTVNEVNQAPILNQIGPKTACPGVLLQFTATATDADIPAQTRTFSLTLLSPPATGASISSSTGVFTWTPTFPQAFATYPVTICVTDNGSPPLQDCETISITVGQCFNAAPVLATIGNKTVNEGSLLTFTATATDADIPAQTLTFSLDAGAPPTAMIAPGGLFTWTPTEAHGPGSYPVTVRVTDSGAPALSDLETISISVNEVNLPPVIAEIGNKVVTEGSILTFTVTATDADLPPNGLTCILPPGAPPGVSLDPLNCTFSFITTECQGPGVYSIMVCVVDNGSPPLTTCQAFSVTITEDNQAPTLVAIGDKTVSEGSLLSFTATATDPDCPSNSLAFTLQGAPLGATIQPSTGVFTWTPTEDQGPNIHTFTVRVTDGTLLDSETIQVTVLEQNSTPLANAGGPYSGVVGVAVNFDGSGSSDAEGDPLAFVWDFGDGGGSTTMSPAHVFVAAALYTVGLRVNDPAGLSDEDVTNASIAPFFTTQVFFTGGNKTTRLASGKASTCVQIEPVNNAYNSPDVDLGSIRMRYGGSSIPAISDKTVIDTDRNHNGVMEITACFSKENLRILFAGLPSGENQVDVTIEGNLLNGGSFQGTAVHQVIASGGALAVSISPNPLNPQATATFQTSREGMVKAQLFDLQGRLIRTLMEERNAPAGYHEVTIDGRDADGHKLSSGIYYLRVQSSVDGTEAMAITILK